MAQLGGRFFFIEDKPVTRLPQRRLRNVPTPHVRLPVPSKARLTVFFCCHAGGQHLERLPQFAFSSSFNSLTRWTMIHGKRLQPVRT